MNKFNKIFISICACVILFCFGIVITGIVDEKKLNDAIDADQYTSQEYEDFQKELSNKTFYYYHNLTDEQKDAYISIYFSVLNFEEKCKVRVNKDDLRVIIDAVHDDNSNIFWLTNGYLYTEYHDYIEITYKYRFEKSEAKKISKELDKEINRIISEMPNFLSDFDKELYIHNYVCNNTIYDKSTIGTTGQSAHGALLDGKTVCEGYARAIQLLLDRVGIKNYLIRGEANGPDGYVAHMWNIVEIDGCNYHLDATWNDSVFEKTQGYFYFNVPDSYIMKTHRNFSIKNTNCIYNSANYFVRQNTYVKTFTGFSAFANATANILKTGENKVQFLFENSSDYKRAVAELKKQDVLFKYVRESVGLSGRNLNKNQVTYSVSDKYYFVSITFKEV